MNEFKYCKSDVYTDLKTYVATVKSAFYGSSLHHSTIIGGLLDDVNIALIDEENKAVLLERPLPKKVRTLLHGDNSLTELDIKKRWISLSAIYFEAVIDVSFMD